MERSRGQDSPEEFSCAKLQEMREELVKESGSGHRKERTELMSCNQMKKSKMLLTPQIFISINE